MYFKLVPLTFIFQFHFYLLNGQGVIAKRINLANCGISKKSVDLKPRIVGGRKVNISKYPWTVSFQKKLRENEEPDHFCGGAIINHRWILSSSHCFQGVKYSIKKVRAVVGSTQWNVPNATFEVDKVFMHEEYDSSNYYNDIALIKTKTYIKFKSDANYFYINSICLPKPNLPLPVSASVYGWGLLDEYSGENFDLMRTTINKTDLSKCNQVYKEYIGKLTKQMMCYSAPGKDACQGDSGGPLSYLNNGREYLIGIVSFGLGCARDYTPGIYSNVALYEDWIKKIINEN